MFLVFLEQVQDLNMWVTDVTIQLSRVEVRRKQT